jgi:hypothetical protein
MIQQHEPQRDDAGPDCQVEASRSLHGSLRAPAQARAFIAERLCRRHDLVASSAAALVASELVTYAVSRGDGPIAVAIECHVTTVSLSVTCSTDGPSGASELRLADPIADMIVAGICRASGTVVADRRLTMWCTIPTGYLPVHRTAWRASP